MSHRAARRYAEALMTAGEEGELLEKISRDFESLDHLLRDSAEFQLFLKSPIISSEKKKGVFRELFGRRTHELTMSFLVLLADKSREDLLPEIVRQFFRLRDERLGIVSVEIRTATELTKDQHRQMEKKFATLTQKTVRLAFSLDKILRGGFVARIGDTVFDGSVKRQLELLRKRFAEGGSVN